MTVGSSQLAVGRKTGEGSENGVRSQLRFFDGFEPVVCRLRKGWVGSRVYYLAHAVHRFGHSFRIVARDVFSYRLGVDLTTGFLQSSGQPFRVAVNLIGNGDCSFHTQSITR